LILIFQKQIARGAVFRRTQFMKNTSLLILLGLVPSAICFSAENRFNEIPRAALGDVAHVFEIVGGEASVGLSFLKRIEVGKDSVVFML
jgi:hypothetical protein